MFGRHLTVEQGVKFDLYGAEIYLAPAASLRIEAPILYLDLVGITIAR